MTKHRSHKARLPERHGHAHPKVYWSRVKALSDGAFAIVLTLLAIEIKVPSVGSSGLEDHLWKELPVFFAFLLAGSVTWYLWEWNRKVTERNLKVRMATHVCMGGHLLSVSLVPWATGLVTHFGVATLTCGIFAAVFLASALPLAALVAVE